MSAVRGSLTSLVQSACPKPRIGLLFRWALCLWLTVGILVPAAVSGAQPTTAPTPTPSPQPQPQPPPQPKLNPPEQPSTSTRSNTPPNAVSEELFNGPVLTFDLQIERAYADRLRRAPRTDVPATLRVGGKTLQKVGVHLKGAAGSFRDLDDQPAFTLDFDEFVPGQEFFGLVKLHLNNSVQDESRLSESIASRMYLESGVPTARAGHAFVRLNGRDLGLYVLKEGYDGRFLQRHFPTQGRPTGNLYDGGFLRDIDDDLERDAGKGPTDFSDLRQLRRAASAPLARRAATLGAVLDIDRFLTLLAIQSLTDDWDGYARNRNNYRVYFDPNIGRAVFIPHGMDQLFKDPGVPVTPDWGGLVARQVMEVPEWQARYSQRLRELVTRQFRWSWVTGHVASVESRVLPALEQRRPGESQQWSSEIRRHSNRIAARIRNVRRQLDLPPDPDLPAPLVRRMQPQVLEGWSPRPQQGVARLDRTPPPQSALHLVALQRGTVASFRTSRSLPPGRYRFEASARTAGVTATAADANGRGVGIRISGSRRDNTVLGNQNWTPLRFDFDLDEEQEVEFILEIRADRGEAWFDPATLKLSGR